MHNEDALIFGNIEVLVSFSSIWYACVMAGRRMMVWLRALLGRCVRRRSRRTTMKRFAAEKISSAIFLFDGQRRKLWE